ncbi:hypothetical protein H5410_046274 [Solanum commersonii]|uniref:Uncharacterized protein n=1 Tax=Solanum commersonii TaxID=4109 RepID=A0A9J5XG15_SOLCO|nr:hypothetical protein H5410_046274 [Solanum commersonii]
MRLYRMLIKGRQDTKLVPKRLVLRQRTRRYTPHRGNWVMRPLRHFRKGKGTSHPEGGEKLPLLEWKLLLYFFRAYRYFEIRKKVYGEVIGMTGGYDCGKWRKSGTIGYLLNQSSNKPSIITTRGEAKLRRQLRFLLASFLATTFSSGRPGKQAIFSIGKIPINNRSEWWGRRPSLLQWKGGNRRFAVAPLLTVKWLSLPRSWNRSQSMTKKIA